MKFAITLNELKKAIKFAEENGVTEYKTIMMYIDNDNETCDSISVSQPLSHPSSDELINITNGEAWFKL